MAKKHNTPKKCKPNKIINFLGVALLCVTGTAILLLVVMENTGISANFLESDVLSLGASFLGILAVFLIGFYIYHCKKNR